MLKMLKRCGNFVDVLIRQCSKYSRNLEKYVRRLAIDATVLEL